MAIFFYYLYLIVFIKTVCSESEDSFIRSVNESHRYYYKAPERIDYDKSVEVKTFTYPLYKFTEIPLYIFEYRASENKYRKLLAGLALYNLASVFYDQKKYNFHENYIKRNDTQCIFKVVHAGQEDEMEVYCGAMTGFIFMSIPKNSDSGNSDALLKIYDDDFDGQPINLEAFNDTRCFIETTNESEEMPCDLLELYATQSLFRVTKKLNESHGYHYAPPAEIIYAGSMLAEEFKKGIYPVYKEVAIPSFIFEYRASKNKYRELLAGLALYNLAVVFSDESKLIRDFHEEYLTHNYTECIFSVVDLDHDYNKYDDMVVDCESITSFIFKRHSDSDFSTSEDDNHGWNATAVGDAVFFNETVITEGLQCFVENVNRKSLYIREEVPCDLLALYTKKTLFSRGMAVSKPKVFLIFIITILVKLIY